MTTVNIKNEDETRTLAAKIGAQLVVGDIVFLKGTLGAGKTAFARALIQSLCGEDTTVPSPTFTLVQQYEAPDINIHHYDLYRIPDEAEDDIIELGWDDSLESAVTLIEWPDRLGHLIPGNRVEITLQHGQNEQERIITITAHGQTQEREWTFE